MADSVFGVRFPQQTQDFPAIQENKNNSLIGVDLISPIDNYRMSERSIKYVMLFLLLTFAAIWLIEVVAKLRVHIAARTKLCFTHRLNRIVCHACHSNVCYTEY